MRISLIATVEVGVVLPSLSVISTLPVTVLPNTTPAEGLLIVKVAVSEPSSKISSLTLTVNVAVV